jgi:uncharacterized protein YndB with AHSA1/START domain
LTWESLRRSQRLIPDGVRPSSPISQTDPSDATPGRSTYACQVHFEAETTIGRPCAEVFDHIARAECLPEYVTQFSWVRQVGTGEPTLGTSYEYKMARGQAAGTFEWTEFDRPSKLAWHGPPAKAGPGSMEPSGRWELSDEGPGTRVKLVMTPQPGGLFKVLAPLMAGQMRKGNVEALRLLKEQIERGPGPTA